MAPTPCGVWGPLCALCPHRGLLHEGLPLPTGSDKCRTDVGRVSWWLWTADRVLGWCKRCKSFTRVMGQPSWLTQKSLCPVGRQQCGSSGSVPSTCSCSDRQHSEARLPKPRHGLEELHLLSCSALDALSFAGWSWCHSSSGQSLPSNLKQHARNNYCFITRSVIWVWKCLSIPAK